jgi:hypothetical protein
MMSSPWGGSQFRNGQVRVPGVDRAPRVDGRHGLGDGPREAQALLGQGVEVGRLRGPVLAVDADMVLPGRVRDDEHHVLAGVGLGSGAGQARDALREVAPGQRSASEQRRARHPRAGELQELSAAEGS